MKPIETNKRTRQQIEDNFNQSEAEFNKDIKPVILSLDWRADSNYQHPGKKEAVSADPSELEAKRIKREKIEAEFKKQEEPVTLPQDLIPEANDQFSKKKKDVSAKPS